MICPKCREVPISLPRYVFTAKGVGWQQAMRGYLRCEKCGTTLRAQSYGLRFWAVAALLAVLIVLQIAFSQQLMRALGLVPTVLLFAAVILLLGAAGSYIEWRDLRLTETASGDTTIDRPHDTA